MSEVDLKENEEAEKYDPTLFHVRDIESKKEDDYTVEVDHTENMVFKGSLLLTVEGVGYDGATENITLYRTAAGTYICSLETQLTKDGNTINTYKAKIIRTVDDIKDFLFYNLRTAKKMYKILPPELNIKCEQRIA